MGLMQYPIQEDNIREIEMSLSGYDSRDDETCTREYDPTWDAYMKNLQ
ncbi:MAG: hypothetical protein H6695_18455 [Deferribacteres bacterium]|nr:hypothetical protein [Deferribacteres bacterium]